ncbi:MAG: zinc-ribbon domain-containing protein [Methyloprofundus sp.]|nr:zinc-ribbon domain-containing protein [Methyloprofundus sp.]
MTTLSPSPNTACQKAIQYFIAIIIILVIGKLISLIPVMGRLQLAGVYKAAEIVWFSTKLFALIMFYYFSRSTIAAIPNNGSILSFVRNVAEPLTILLIVIIGQELFWQLLEPFVQNTGKKIYFSLAIIFIVTISIWLAFRAYQSALYLFEASQKIAKYLSRFISDTNKTCMACGAKIRNNAMFCSYCGCKTVEQASCSECGEVLLSNERFCRHCGTEVKENPDFSE